MDINLTQEDLNQSLRGLKTVDITMFVPDRNIVFPDNAVTVNNTPLRFTSNPNSLVEFSRIPQANLATFENNSWILDGSFISPSEAFGGGGDSYTGYISNDYTDDNGDYSTNPIITIRLAALVETMQYLSLRFAGGIDTSYPKILKIRTYTSDILIREHTFDMTLQSGLPLMVAEIMDEQVNKVEFEFVGTQCPHRRTRLSKILFGKAEQVDINYLQSWRIDDKVSLVADSIPTKLLEYTIINYEKDYDIDNPGVSLVPEDYKNVLVLFSFGMERGGLWKYAPTKTFNLLDVSTTSEGIVTFTCGSILDTLTEIYDQDVYSDELRSIRTIVSNLLTFSNVGTDQVIYEDTEHFADYQINMPIPEATVRDIIQKLALSCGATLLVDDDNKIVFAKKNIETNSSTLKFMYHRPNPFDSAGVILQEPHAEALANTTDIGMYTYNTKTVLEYKENEQGEQIVVPSELGTANISLNGVFTRISFSPAKGAVTYDYESLAEQGSISLIAYESFSQHAIVKLNWDEDDPPEQLPVKLKILGTKVETTQISPYVGVNAVEKDKRALIIDSGLAYTEPFNIRIPSSGTRDETTFYYDEWYGAKFKYVLKTRNEYLIKAGDIILFETPFTDGEPTRRGYVLRNSYSNNNDSGEMEVISLD